MFIPKLRQACQLLGLAALLGSAAVAAAVQQVSEPGRRAISPEIAVGPDGSIHVIWLDKGLIADEPAAKARKPGEHSHRSSTDLYFSRSSDGGRSWSRPARVNREAGEVWGFAVSKPRIAVGQSGTIHVFFPGNEKSPVTGFDVVTARYTRSTDGGTTFEPARTLHGASQVDQREMLGEGLAATYSFGTMGLGPDGAVYAAWQDVTDMSGMNDGANVYVAVSRDDGKTFSAERRVISGGAVCPCCQLTLAFGAEDVFIGYRRLYADGRDSTVARSGDGGASFEGDARLPFAKWEIDACPLKPTELAVDGQRVYAASYTGGEEPAGLYFSYSTDGGATFGGARQVHPQAPYSDAPALEVSPGGAVHLVWQAKLDGPRRLFVTQSSDGGQTLTAPVEIEAPPGNAANPATALGTDGTLYVAWEQDSQKIYVQARPTRPSVAAR